MILGIGKIKHWPKVTLRLRSGQEGLRLKIKKNFSQILAFTLVEMLIVLAIVGLIMAISIPFTAGFGKGLRIKTAARAIVGIMYVARSNAVTFRKNYSVAFDVKKSQYWIEDEAEQIYEKKYYLPCSIKFEIKGDEEADPVTFENDKVTFTSSGSAKGVGGTVTLTDREGESRTISVAGATGRIAIN
jgi:prepilin-type N-terminal cleavage/methylation domain-containing protein